LVQVIGAHHSCGPALKFIEIRYVYSFHQSGRIYIRLHFQRFKEMGELIDEVVTNVRITIGGRLPEVFQGRGAGDAFIFRRYYILECSYGFFEKNVIPCLDLTYIACISPFSGLDVSSHLIAGAL